MSKTQTASQSRSDGELCRNSCGFYGNKIWDGYCSKCYREVYQQAKQTQETNNTKSNNSSSNNNSPSTIQSSASFSNFQEKRRSNMNMRNPLRHMVNRAGSLRSNNNPVSPTSPNDEHIVEAAAASQLLDAMTSDEARLDIKFHVKNFANSFHKKCSTKSIPIEAIIQEYASFKDALRNRILTNPIYQDENEDLISHVRNYVEKLVFSRDYSFIFNRIAIACEEKDLAIQNRISSLHWVTAPMLDTVLNDNIPNAHEAMFKAINALIELDSKSTPQGKIQSIMDCKKFIEDAIRSSSSSSGINADSFLPALIFIVLRAKPPRIHSNIQFLSHFSQPDGEQLYYLANLDSAIRFIELLQARHLGLSSDDFSLYMRGEPVLPSKIGSLFDASMSNESNNQHMKNRFFLFHELDHHYEKFDENIADFNRRLTQTVTDVKELLNGTYSRFAYFEKIPQLIDIESTEPLDLMSKKTMPPTNPIDILDQSTAEDEQLPEPLAPEIVQQTNNDK